jgi:hypothetical protein
MTVEAVPSKPVVQGWRAHGLAVLGSGLMAVVVLAYYGRGGLLAPEPLAVWFGVGADLLGALAVALPCAGLGQQLLIWARVRLPSGGERALVAFVLGVGAMALVTLGLGLAGGLSEVVAVMILSAAAALSVRRALGVWWGDVRDGARVLLSPTQGGRLAGGVTALALATSFLLALAPPLGWDALAYHLTLARQYALRGDLAVDPVNVFMGMPQTGEMVYTLAILLRGEGSAQLLGWMMAALAVVGLGALTGRLVGGQWAPWSGAILFSAPTVAEWPAWGYVDFLTFAAMVAALTVLTTWRYEGGRRLLIVAGVTAGIAMGTKYTALSVPVGIGLAVLVFSPGPQRLRQGLLFGGVVALVFAPWLLKNTLLTGNPVYPLLLETPTMDAWRHLFYSRPDLISRDPWSMLGRLPTAVLSGRYGAEYSDATLSPLWVLLPLVAGLAWRRMEPDPRRVSALLATVASGAYLVWIGLGQLSHFGALPRLFMPVFAPLIVLAVLGLASAGKLDGPSLRFSWMLRAVVGLVLTVAAGLVSLGFAQRQPLWYLAGTQTASAYQGHWQGWYQAAIEAVVALPADAQIEFLWEPRALACPDRCRGDVIADRWYHLRRTVGGADQILAYWRELGITHVLIYTGAAEYERTALTSLLTPEDWEVLTEMRARLQPVRAFGGAYDLYALPDRDPVFPRNFGCPGQIGGVYSPHQVDRK